MYVCKRLSFSFATYVRSVILHKLYAWKSLRQFRRSHTFDVHAEHETHEYTYTNSFRNNAIIFASVAFSTQMAVCRYICMFAASGTELYYKQVLWE